MESIKKLYKKGYGPSSSHTLGPNRAAITFREKNPTAAKFRVTLQIKVYQHALEMEKDWEMMSEFDKDEIIRKKIIREL